MIISLLCIISTAANGQPVANTVDAVDGMIRSLTDSLLARHEGPSFSFSVQPHPDAEWIGGIIGRRCQERGRVTRQLGVDSIADVIISISDVSTRYQLLESSDSVRRVIVVNLNARNGSSESAGLVLALPSMKQEDMMLREVAISSESMQHRGTHGDIPPMPSSFWDDVAQPAIFIAAAATTVILLFTVRSQ
ncbi:MAG: hypothetical protein NTX15_09165 [Candidatus Kapabacteria bacterium]|nr:hypothetical protein [Candidatus Kapabacteria bacterium]